jgi:hypothetical protein
MLNLDEQTSFEVTSCTGSGYVIRQSRRDEHGEVTDDDIILAFTDGRDLIVFLSSLMGVSV